MINFGGKGGIIRNGLIYHIDFNNIKSYNSVAPTAVSDLSTSQIDGTLVNSPSVITHKDVQCLDLNGTNQYLTANGLASNFPSLTSVTIDLWYSADTPTTGSLLSWYNAVTPDRSIRLSRIGTGGSDFWVQRRDPTNRLDQVLNDQDDGIDFWNNVVYTFNSSGPLKNFYINNKNVTLTTPSGGVPDFTNGISPSPNRFAIGVSQTSGSTSLQQYFDGKIGSLKIYSRNLSAIEVDHNYRLMAKRFGKD